MPELLLTPPVFRHDDGTSGSAPSTGTLFSATDILQAEDRLPALAASGGGPAASIVTMGRALRRALPGGERLSAEQTLAVEKIAVSGRMLGVLVGPADTGKTTTVAGLRTAWERQHGPGTVVGLAPSAAADVLSAGLRIGPRTEGDGIVLIASTGARADRDAEVTGEVAGFSCQMIRPLCVEAVLTAS